MYFFCASWLNLEYNYFFSLHLRPQLEIENVYYIYTFSNIPASIRLDG